MFETLYQVRVHGKEWREFETVFSETIEETRKLFMALLHRLDKQVDYHYELVVTNNDIFHPFRPLVKEYTIPKFMEGLNRFADYVAKHK